MRTLFLLLAALLAQRSHAFCGFYVARADATLFNDRSEVILVRDGQRTIVTMSNDFQGDVKDFAMVVPVPVVLRQQDIRIVDRRVFSMLDAYSSPRLVEYHDENPCHPPVLYEAEMDAVSRPMPTANASRMKAEAKDLGVTIEAQYAVGEYDILILSATESTGLKQWLVQNGYRIPETAHEVLDPYIRSNLKFFVVKVDVSRLQLTGSTLLRPIQIRYDSHKFMLPIRLGMANSKGSQDMVVYAFTRTGRVECVNYRTVKVPTDRNIPLFVKQKFGPFYKDLFARAHRREGRNVVFLEYAWNVTPSFGGMKCDPCVGPPPMPREFADAGVDRGGVNGGGGQVFFTRLHVRYGREKFPQDLVFQVTPNTEHFQARYVLTNPATGDLSCASGQDYLEELYYRRHRELEELHALTGWDITKRQSYLKEISDQLPEERRNGLPGWTLPLGPPNGGDAGPGAPPRDRLIVLGTLLLLALGLWRLRTASAAP